MLLDRYVLAKAFQDLGNELIAPGDRIAIPLNADRTDVRVQEGLSVPTEHFLATDCCRGRAVAAR
jgi:hypothetical protein